MSDKIKTLQEKIQKKEVLAEQKEKTAEIARAAAKQLRAEISKLKHKLQQQELFELSEAMTKKGIAAADIQKAIADGVIQNSTAEPFIISEKTETKETEETEYGTDTR